jgi:hypothetical protein
MQEPKERVQMLEATLARAGSVLILTVVPLGLWWFGGGRGRHDGHTPPTRSGPPGV